MVYINNKDKIESIKLTDDNYIIVADFDKTITHSFSDSTWGVTAHAKVLSKEYSSKREKLFEKYRPIEIDPKINDEEKSKYMSEWWNKHIDLFFEYGLTENILDESIDISIENKNLLLRDGAKEFLYNMKEKGIPLLIISAGIGNVIERYLKYEKSYFDNIYIVSNFIEFENDLIKGIKDTPIHSLNKNIVNISDDIKQIVSTRPYKVLFGDGLADLKMININDLESTITIGFLDANIEENLEVFNSNFDIVITNEGSFDDVNKIINIY